MNKAVEYIENNLQSEICTADAAAIAGCSEFHFQRVFAYITGVTVLEYIRRRKMTAAAFELLEGNVKITDVARRYGYDYLTSFNRAFQNVHGVPPSMAKNKGVQLTTFSRITFTMSIKGEKAMNYKIVKKEPFRIVGYVTREAMTMENCFEKIPPFWEKVTSEGGIQRLCALRNSNEPQGILGVSTCEGGEYGGFFIAVSSDSPVPAGMEEYTIPETTYAVFEAVGALPDSIQEIQQRIISEWLPSSGYEYAPAPDIEVYPEGDQHSDNYKCEVWLPIIKR